MELDRAAFAAGIEVLRGSTSSIVVTVLDELVDGDRYAERHRIELVQQDGVRVAREVFVFARLAQDGRFLTIDEATLPAA